MDKTITPVRIVFFTALIIRLLYLGEQSLTPFFDTPYLDEKYHLEWAQYLVQGNESDFIDLGVYYKGPFYPWFLGIFIYLFGSNLFLLRLVQILIGSFSCVILFKICEMLYSKRSAFIAGLVMAFYPILIFYNGELLIESLYIFLSLLAFYVLFQDLKNNISFWLFFLSGILFGLSAITRPNILLFFPILILLISFDLLKEYGWHRKYKIILFLVIGILLPILPVTFLNWTRGNDFVLISSQGGINFYMGNNHFADGHSAKTDIRYDYKGHYRDSVEYYSLRKMQDETGKIDIKPSEISKYWFQKSINWMRSNPIQALNLELKKLILFLNGFELPDNKNIYFMKEKSLVLKLTMIILNFYILIPLGILGFILLARNPGGRLMVGYAICYSLSVILFFVGSRYRTPVIPFFILGTAIFLDWILKDGKSFFHKKFWMIAFLLLFLLGSVDWYKVKNDFNPAENDWMYGNVYLERVLNHIEKEGFYNPADLKKAREYFEMALQKFPSGSPDFYIVQQVYLDYGKSYYLEGKPEKALENWQKMLDEYDRIEDKTFMKVDFSLLKSSCNNISILYQDKAEKTMDILEKKKYIGWIQYYQKRRDEFTVQ